MDMELGDVLEVAARLSPRGVLRALVLLGMVVYLAVPAVREPVVEWWVSYKADQLTSRLEPLLHQPATTPAGGRG